VEVKTDFVTSFEETGDNPLQGVDPGGIAKQSFYKENASQSVFPEDLRLVKSAIFPLRGDAIDIAADFIG